MTAQDTEVGQAWESPFPAEGPSTAWFAPDAGAGETNGQAVGTSGKGLGFIPWTENESPFAESPSDVGFGGDGQAELAEVFAQLRDDEFDEAVLGLVDEVQEAVGERFEGESGGLTEHRERLADAHLAPIGFEAEQYVDQLASGLAGVDLASLSEQQLDEVLAGFDATIPSLSPAGEEFLGKWVKKAKSVVNVAVSTAKKIGKGVLGPVVEAALKRLRKLVRPIMKRVLAFAIGKLPANLQPAARTVAGKLGFEAEIDTESSLEGVGFSPAVRTDPVMLAESVDLALAEVVAGGPLQVTAELESFGSDELEDEGRGSDELEVLGQARDQLLTSLESARDGQDLAPAVEQFVPALLGALRIGIRLAGRPRVVGFLAKAVSALIGKWVGPQLAGPLSSAIVDTGLRLATLESPEPDAREGEGGPAVLAATIEDTVRRFAENEEFVFEDEDLSQLALAEAFDEAVAANFPAQLVRPDLRLAPSLGGSFVTRRPRASHAYRKFSRVPMVDVTPQIAAAVRVRGGTTLAAAMSAAGLPVPGKYRVHVFNALPGTTLRNIARIERRLPGLGRGGARRIWPLSPEAATALLREPGLGTTVPGVYRRNTYRIAAGQRFFYLEPAAGTRARAPQLAAGPGDTRAPASSGDRATQGWVRLDLIRSQVKVAVYFSESEAQAIAGAIRQGRGTPALLKALSTSYDAVSRSFGDGSGRVVIVKELDEGEEFLGSAARRLAPQAMDLVKDKLRAWAMTMFAQWARGGLHEFERAAADPRPGVTVTLHLTAVPGLGAVRQAINGRLPMTAGALNPSTLFAGQPSGSVVARAGVHRP